MFKLASLGSTNPGKLEACRLCFAQWPQLSTCDIRGISVPSGVPDQPNGWEETLRGAKNRSEAALKCREGADIGIGLESGIVAIGATSFDVCACAIFDGANDCHYVGLSSAFAIPPRVLAMMGVGGATYNDALEATLGAPPDANGSGVLGQLSGGVLTRPSQMKESIQMAMVQAINQHHYRT